MPKRVRDAILDTRAARAKLKARSKPYYRSLDRGLHLGYRRGKHGGTWMARRYVGDEQYVVVSIGLADDNQDADGTAVFNFHQAQDRARGHAAAVVEEERVTALGPAVTVRSAIESYLLDRESRERAQNGVGALKRDCRSRLTRHVLSVEALAATDLNQLTEDALSTWRSGMVGKLAEASIRRTASDLKAAINLAAKRHRARVPLHLPTVIKHGLAVTEAAAPVAREQQILADADIRRIIAAAKEVDAAEDWEGDLARLVLVLAATGARFSQVARLTVADVQRPQMRLMIPVSRKGRGAKAVGRTGVRVGDDVMEALRPATAGRKGPDILLLRPRWRQIKVTEWEKVGRAQWLSSAELTRPWRWITEQAELPADIVPYALRHSSIVRMLGAGLPIRLVAALHDTSSAMIERHYSAYVVDAMDELAARAVVPLTSASVGKLNFASSAGSGGGAHDD